MNPRYLFSASLRGRFLVMLSACYVLSALAAVVGFAWIVDDIVQNLGVRFAQKQVLYDKARIEEPILREITLSRTLAASPLLHTWAQDEDNAALKQQALAELENYRAFFHDGSYFVVLDRSLHYYFNDRAGSYTDQPLRYTLNPTTEEDRWYRIAADSGVDYTLNVDHDRALNVTKIWINTVMRRADGQVLGLTGSGLDLSEFIKNFIGQPQPGITNILLDDSGAIQAHPDPRQIDYRSQSKDATERHTVFKLLDDPADTNRLRTAFMQLRDGKTQVETRFVNIAGRYYLAGVAYLPSLRWFNMTLMDLDSLIGQRPFLPMLGLLALALLVVLLLTGIMLSRLVLRRLARLDAATQRIAEGDYRLDLHDDAHDEIARLSAGFQQMANVVRDHTQNLEQKVAQRTDELAASNRQLTDSIHYARLIQAALLPESARLTTAFIEHAVLWRPRDIVGGDYYFLLPQADGCYFGIADCTGHGVPGALMATLSSALLHQAVQEAPAGDITAVLTLVDQRLHAMLDSQQDTVDHGLDIALCYLDPVTATLTFAGTGLHLYWTIDGGQFETLTGQRRRLGQRRAHPLQAATVQRLTLQPGQRFYLASDGLIDQAGGTQGFGFGRQRLFDTLKEHAAAPLPAQVDALAAALAAYQGERPQRDDITFFAFVCRTIPEAAVGARIT